VLKRTATGIPKRRRVGDYSSAANTSAEDALSTGLGAAARLKSFRNPTAPTDLSGASHHSSRPLWRLAFCSHPAADGGTDPATASVVQRMGAGRTTWKKELLIVDGPQPSGCSVDGRATVNPTDSTIQGPIGALHRQTQMKQPPRQICFD